MRGKVNPRYLFPLRSGITPAYAGKRFPAAVLTVGDQDHPRLCGEKRTALTYWRDLGGSPPPMRGKVQRTLQAGLHDGITPAYAGKRCTVSEFQTITEDHPRLCGEKACFFPLCISELGSPPPMRGKVDPEFTESVTFRITPAYAGKSGTFPQCQRCNRDHPRLCGEKYLPTGQGQRRIGSPPPMRGKDSTQPRTQPVPGITPAYAGKSLRPAVRAVPRQDHPRLCGEKSRRCEMEIDVRGSPPPMRGKVFQKLLHNPLPRITPAYAGKSPFFARWLLPFQDHPRLCGEKQITLQWIEKILGSPPPMRGKAPNAEKAYHALRITPAYAGKRLFRPLTA